MNMHVVGFAGYSGSGKTTLIERLIPALRARGQRVSVVKHAHHGFDVDYPGKDTHRHRTAGAYEVLAASRQRVVLMHENEQPAEPDVHALIAQLDARAGWVLVEGFKDADLPKIAVWRAGLPPHPQDAHTVAVAADAALQTTLPVHNLNAPAALADWLLAHAERFTYHRRQP
ncbi:MAG: molybdopterin-guanine dinucleotide biosynthesis protein B [Acidovorax sp.]